jgi:succinate dehydrogenase / fumarate reductase, iron-sulfur subunit
MSQGMTLQLRVWRQADSDDKGRFVEYTMQDVSPHMSFLEMLDVLNEDLIKKGELPIEFDSDCREGICGTCGVVVNGSAHGHLHATTVCQLHMRHFKHGDRITIEPWRARAFPVIKDLVVDRSAFDRIVASGGYISVNTGGAPDANAIPISKEQYEQAMDSAACISCGACVAACPNGSAALFTGAKIDHLTTLAQGQVERAERALAMVRQMDEEGFGNCTNHGECEAVCPKAISIKVIARMRREYLRGMLK